MWLGRALGASPVAAGPWGLGARRSALGPQRAAVPCPGEPGAPLALPARALEGHACPCYTAWCRTAPSWGGLGSSLDRSRTGPPSPGGSVLAVPHEQPSEPLWFLLGSVTVAVFSSFPTINCNARLLRGPPAARAAAAPGRWHWGLWGALATPWAVAPGGEAAGLGCPSGRGQPWAELTCPVPARPRGPCHPVPGCWGPAAGGDRLRAGARETPPMAGGVPRAADPASGAAGPWGSLLGWVSGAGPPPQYPRSPGERGGGGTATSGAGAGPWGTGCPCSGAAAWPPVPAEPAAPGALRPTAGWRGAGGAGGCQPGLQPPSTLVLALSLPSGSCRAGIWSCVTPPTPFCTLFPCTRDPPTRSLRRAPQACPPSPPPVGRGGCRAGSRCSAGSSGYQQGHPRPPRPQGLRHPLHRAATPEPRSPLACTPARPRYLPHGPAARCCAGAGLVPGKAAGPAPQLTGGFCGDGLFPRFSAISVVAKTLPRPRTGPARTGPAGGCPPAQARLTRGLGALGHVAPTPGWPGPASGPGATLPPLGTSRGAARLLSPLNRGSLGVRRVPSPDQAGEGSGSGWAGTRCARGTDAAAAPQLYSPAVASVFRLRSRGLTVALSETHVLTRQKPSRRARCGRGGARGSVLAAHSGAAARAGAARRLRAQRRARDSLSTEPSSARPEGGGRTPSGHPTRVGDRRPGTCSLPRGRHQQPPRRQSALELTAASWHPVPGCTHPFIVRCDEQSVAAEPRAAHLPPRRAGAPSPHAGTQRNQQHNGSGRLAAAERGCEAKRARGPGPAGRPPARPALALSGSVMRASPAAPEPAGSCRPGEGPSGNGGRGPGLPCPLGSRPRSQRVPQRLSEAAAALV